jgi:hypothetical protein
MLCNPRQKQWVLVPLAKWQLHMLEEHALDECLPLLPVAWLLFWGVRTNAQAFGQLMAVATWLACNSETNSMNSVFYTSRRFVDQSIATDISALQFCFSLSLTIFSSHLFIIGLVCGPLFLLLFISSGGDWEGSFIGHDYRTQSEVAV